MEIWFKSLLQCLIVPLIMIGSGRLMYGWCTKKMRKFIGYRTARSKKDERAWRFANACCGRIYYKAGISLLAGVLVAFALFMAASPYALHSLKIGVFIVELLTLIAPVIITEEELKKAFPENSDK